MKKECSSNFVLNAKSKQFYWEGNGQLSIKTFTNGNAHYKTNKGFFAVEENRYLLLNKGPYTISIDEDNVIESFCIFFKEGLAEEVFRNINESTMILLSDPFKEIDSIGFFEKTYNTDLILSSQIKTIKDNITFFENDPLWLDEQFFKLMQTMLFEHINTLQEAESILAIKRSTREELYRRVSIAHDYIRAFYNQPIKLQDIAQVSCLSPNHLLRNYSRIYGKTPHEHISEFRILKSKQLLSKIEFNITDITYEVGFSNPASFSKMFKQHVGISPLQFRNKK
ncbi:AraC family transcriptional regulator [Psychrobacillus sp. FSL K6-4615]|uniref:helix-turn-helix domain-containing protein n=1 Tax=Psychrobacillus sp. FSL K6-4615 TaxID=2921551 RepID=UPI0030F63480